MKRNQLHHFLYVTIIFFACNNHSSNTLSTPQQAAAQRIVIIDPEAASILDSTAVIETLGEGFNWTEGPLYIKDGDYFIFSDIPENKIFKWKEGQGVTTYLTPSGNTGKPKPNSEQGSNGLVLDTGGHLVLCQDGDRRMARMESPLNEPRPKFVTLTDNYKGKRFNSPNDAAYHANGDLYFTDPAYGLPKGIYDSAKELDFQGVFRLKPNGQLDLFAKELKYPNGIAFSPDYKYLYVSSSDSTNYMWMRYELDSAGMVKASSTFYEAHAYEGKHLGAPDGMKINKKGYLFATGPEGIWLFNPAGKLIARIYTGQLTANCAFSSDETCTIHDLRRLYHEVEAEVKTA